jgi:UDP-N-acetylmuramoyl-L-alanyl-D-glutamate--2,6-diaminopimelate ligase
MAALQLKQLLSTIPNVEVRGNKDIMISGVANNSQAVGPGFIFIAKRGRVFDANAFVPEAMRAGAVCIVSDTFDPSLKGMTQIITPQVEVIEAVLVHAFWGNPTRDLSVIGITGTSGKTTIAYLLRHIFEKANEPCGLIGSIEYAYGSVQYEAKRTTPDIVTLVKLFAKMKQAGMKRCVMEVTSHACSQKRVEGILFQGGIYTNLSHDHLDYHTTMEEYAKAKKLFFEQLSCNKGSFAVVNQDDPWHSFMIHNRASPVLTYSMKNPQADFFAHSVSFSNEKMVCTIEAFQKSYRLETFLIGRYNVMNILAAIAAAYASGIAIETSLEALKSFLGAPGRLERVPNDLDITAVVDFSHKEDALRNALRTLREVTNGSIITVFGCGGDRDKLKRPLMARAAEELSDSVIVTLDNPRSENPKDIISEICKGFQTNKWIAIEDRRQAIERACEMAKPQDVVLIAGKGHEKVQIFHQQTFPFDDRQEVQKACSTIAQQRMRV